MRGKEIWPFLIVSMVLLGSSFSVDAMPEELEIYNPQLVPRLNMTYTQLIPGESTDRDYTLLNVYTFPITNITLEMELYRYRTLEESKDPSNIPSPPKISDTGQLFNVQIADIAAESNATFTHPVKTTEDTPEGTYFIRTILEFDANGSHFVMPSRGHFDDVLWKEAISNNSVFKAIDGENVTTGGVNLTHLDVDGIFVETSITVKSPRAMWPFYVLAGVTAFFGISALVFYLQEEKNMFPKAEWAYQRLKGRWVMIKLDVNKKLKKKR